MSDTVDRPLTYAFERNDDRPGLPRFTWSVIGPQGGVHIWAQTHSEASQRDWGDQFYGGVECHWPAESGKNDHEDCWLLKKPCRHDGSSLYFSERIEPMLRGQDPESDAVRSYIESILFDWYRSHIDRSVEGAD